MTEQELHAIQEQPATSVDPSESARLAGLRYVSDDTPGIRRERQGDRFRLDGDETMVLEFLQERLAWSADRPGWAAT